MIEYALLGIPTGPHAVLSAEVREARFRADPGSSKVYLPGAYEDDRGDSG